MTVIFDESELTDDVLSLLSLFFSFLFFLFLFSSFLRRYISESITIRPRRVIPLLFFLFSSRLKLPRSQVYLQFSKSAIQ